MKSAIKRMSKIRIFAQNHQNISAMQIGKISRALIVLAIVSLSLSACTSSRYGRPKRKKGCGCPAWSYQQQNEQQAQTLALCMLQSGLEQN